jgi:hypothetical protein
MASRKEKAWICKRFIRKIGNGEWWVVNGESYVAVKYIYK